MQIFEYPNIIFTIFVIVLLILGGTAICFAIKGLKTSNYEDENVFATISKLENYFVKSTKLLGKCCVLYINVLLDDYRSLHSEPETERIFTAVKQILLNSFSPLKSGSISKYSDCTFVVCTILSEENVREIVDDFNDSLIKCLTANKALNVVDVKIGAAFTIGTDVPFDEAMGRAKQACVLAKNQKKLYVEWNRNSGKALERKIKIENNIENEIDNNRFFLVYQPVLDAKTKEIVGLEALSRLNSSSGGIISPDCFLSAVDSVGINNKFDYYIFEKNCKWISNDKEKRESYKYNINFSRETMCEPEFVEKILDIINKYELNPSCLAIEILEDKNIDDEARTQMMENLTALKNEGISILLDDFGSGVTKFEDLQSLDISVVKIDSAITQNSATEKGYIILENIIRTAKNIGFKTLCEGVETKEQEEAVIRAGCDLLQGYYYYKPMPASMVENLFDKEEA